MPLIRRNVVIRRSRASGWARLFGGLALPVLILGVLGTRAGLVPEMALQPVLVTGFLLGVAALIFAVYALVDIWSSGADGTGSAVVGIVYASPVLVILGLISAAAIVYPRITDVVTDASDPPVFTGPTGPRGVPDAAALARQVAAYPDITPHIYPLPLGDVFAATRKIVDSSGWTVTSERRPAVLPTAASPDAASQAVADDPELKQALAAKSVMTQSRGGYATEALPAPADDAPLPAPEPDNVATIEGTAPTLIFGFTDDVVVRLTMEDDGSTQVDMRSASRIGAHDLGENARRIKSFFAKLDAVLQPEPGPGGVASAAQ